MTRPFFAILCLFSCAATVGCGSTVASGSGSTAAADTASEDTGLSGSDAATDAAAGTDAATGTDSAAGTDSTAGTDAASVDTGPSIDNLPCPSGVTSFVGQGTDMAPGGACIQCHNSGEGPNDLIAGTVFRNLITLDGCDANAAGSLVAPTSYTVEITDANGKVFKTTSSPTSGNFRIGSNAMPGFTPPYKARIVDSAGGTRAMVKAQNTGDCNSCHTATGSNGAPGRIVAP